MKKRIGIGIVVAMLASLAVVGVAGAWGPSYGDNDCCYGGYQQQYQQPCCQQQYYQPCCQQQYYQPCCQQQYYQPCCQQQYYQPCYQKTYCCYSTQTYYWGPSYNDGCGYGGCYGGQKYDHMQYGGNNYYYGYNAGYQKPW